MRFLIADLPLGEQLRIRAQNAREMQQLVNENHVVSGVSMEGVEYHPQNIYRIALTAFNEWHTQRPHSEDTTQHFYEWLIRERNKKDL